LGQAVTFLASSPLSPHGLLGEPRVRIGSVLVTPAPSHALQVSQAYHIALRGNQALPARSAATASSLAKAQTYG